MQIAPGAASRLVEKVVQLEMAESARQPGIFRFAQILEPGCERSDYHREKGRARFSVLTSKFLTSASEARH